jgi:hypothetical protein
MAGASEAGNGRLRQPSADAGAGSDRQTNDLIAQIRELTVDDPQAVHQVVAEVLAALDRVTGRARPDRLPDENPG